MTLRLPFNWQKTRFSMYCCAEIVSGEKLRTNAQNHHNHQPSSIQVELEASWASWGLDCGIVKNRAFELIASCFGIGGPEQPRPGTPDTR